MRTKEDIEEMLAFCEFTTPKELEFPHPGRVANNTAKNVLLWVLEQPSSMDFIEENLKRRRIKPQQN